MLDHITNRQDGVSTIALARCWNFDTCGQAESRQEI